MTTIVETFFTGTTIRPVVTFHDWAEFPAEGALIDPDLVNVTLYDAEENIMGSVQEAVFVSLGTFSYDWTLPINPGKYFIEFKGIIDGEPVIIRKEYAVKFKGE